jgi:hypothetical protein
MSNVCTVVTRNYLPFARALTRSILRHDPGRELWVMIADAEVGASDQVNLEGVTLLSTTDIGIDANEVERRGAMFGPNGLACSLKAPLLRHVVRTTGQPSLYLDADGLVFGSLSVIFDLAESAGLVLSPHLHEPISREDAGFEVEETFLKYGVFNGGLVATTEAALPFLEWWTERTSRRCIVAPEQSYIVDQHWLTLAPALFPSAVLRHQGTNVMWWNLYERDITWMHDSPTVVGIDLLHFHFAGFDFGAEVTLGPENQAWRARFPSMDQRPGLMRMCAFYASELQATGFDCSVEKGAPYVRLPDGSLFTDEHRHRYRELVEWAELHGHPEPPNPFRGDPSAPH